MYTVDGYSPLFRHLKGGKLQMIQKVVYLCGALWTDFAVYDIEQLLQRSLRLAESVGGRVVSETLRSFVFT